MKKVLLIALLLALFVAPVLASDIEVQEDSTKVGNATKLDFQGNLDVTWDGFDTAVIDYDEETLSTAAATHASVSTMPSTTVLSTDDKKVYVSTATQPTTFTLPEAAAGLQYGFVAGTYATISISPYSSSDTIVYLTLDAGDELDGGGIWDGVGGTGDSVTLMGDTDTWYITQMGSNAFSDGGAE